jgi:hypothetical protein
MKLESLTIPVSAVTPYQIAEMFRLMQVHYDGVSESQFLDDLRGKNWVILLHEEGRLRGFSTQAVFSHEISDRQVNVLFSGDTIIEKSHWGSLALPVAWGRLMTSLQASDPAREFYWLLTTKGYKTYRFLPVFFRDFHPCPGVIMPPFERTLINNLATLRFGTRFDAGAGILRASQDSQRLRKGIAEIDEKRLRDPHVEFFQRMNPDHGRGDELVCLARWHPDNLTPYIRRQL